MDEKYSNRKIIFENNNNLIDDSLDEDSQIDELDELINLIESNNSYSNDLNSELDRDENLDDELSAEDIVETIKDNQELITADIEEEKIVEIEDKNSVEENEDEPVIEDSIDVDSSLKTQNNSIKLDLFLKHCTDKNFAYKLLRYKNEDVDFNSDKDTLINKTISNFDLKTIMDFKYKYNDSSIETIFDSFIKPLKVVDLVEIAEKYDVKVSLSKENLKNNFMEKFSPYDLILILNKEGLKIRDYSSISVLEQIYLLNDSILEKNIDKCPNIEKSRYEMISCIVNHYSDGFLISNNQLDLGDDVK